MTDLYKKLSHLLPHLPAAKSLAAGLGAQSQVFVTGLVPSLDSLVIADTFHRSGRPIVLVAESEEEADRLFDDLSRLVGESSLALFTEGAKASAVKSALHKAQGNRDAQLLEALERITGATVPLITVTSHQAATMRLPERKEFEHSTLRLKVGELAPMQLLVNWLRDRVFDEKQFVETNGDYSRRGGIVDVFPYTETVPFRIEFFGDMIESIREFDAISQRSIAHRQELALVGNALAETTNMRTIFDYMPTEAIAVLYEPERFDLALEEQQAEDVKTKLATLTRVNASSISSGNAGELRFDVSRQPNFGANMKLIREHLHELVAKGNADLPARRVA